MEVVVLFFLPDFFIIRRFPSGQGFLFFNLHANEIFPCTRCCQHIADAGEYPMFYIDAHCFINIYSHLNPEGFQTPRRSSSSSSSFYLPSIALRHSTCICFCKSFIRLLHGFASLTGKRDAPSLSLSLSVLVIPRLP